MGRDEVDADVTAPAERLRGAPEDHEEQEEGPDLVDEELGAVEEVPHEHIEGDEHGEDEHGDPGEQPGRPRGLRDHAADRIRRLALLRSP